MIQEQETFDKYEYYPSDLKPRSGKPILAACDDCRKVRETTKHDYRALCSSCVKKCRKDTERTKSLKSAAHAGKNAYNYKPKIKCFCLWCGRVFESSQYKIDNRGGKYCSRRCTAFATKREQRGEKNPNYNGGRKAVRARCNAKRRRNLGYILPCPLGEGEVGHHVTNEYVVGIPKDVHKKISGGFGRKKHRALVLQWLKANDKRKYKFVLDVLTL
jgi:hypothetical protein